MTADAVSRTATALARVLIAADRWLEGRRRWWALKALSLATRLPPRTVMEIALAGAAAAGFKLMKDGQEYAVLCDGQRIVAPPAAGPEDSGLAAQAVQGGQSSNGTNPSPSNPSRLEEEGRE